MNVTTKTIEPNKVELTITVSAEEFAKGLDTAFEKVRKDVSVEGFRKGKIPRNMFEKKFGVEVLYEDALNAVFPVAYNDALTSEGISPVDYPEWDVKEIDRNTGVVATATVWVKPAVELGDYKGLNVTQLSEDVTEDEILAEIDKLSATRSEMIVKEGAAVVGDTVVLDYEGFKDGVAFEGGKGENHSLELGSNSFIPGFEEQVVGMSAGEERDITVTFPEAYHSADLAGAEAVFKINAHEVKTRQLPAIDDEFVKDLDRDGIETVDALREDIINSLTETKKNAAKNHVTNSVIEQAVANAKFDVPAVMIDNEIDSMIKRLEQQYSQQGITLEMFLQFSGQTMETLRDQMKVQAESNVKQSLVMEAIVENESVDVTDEDLDSELATMAQMYGMELETIKTMIPDLTMLKDELKTRKTIDLMIESAKLA